MNTILVNVMNKIKIINDVNSNDEDHIQSNGRNMRTFIEENWWKAIKIISVIDFFVLVFIIIVALSTI
jgi:hypothetical protein